MAYAAIADRDHAHALHEPQSFLTKYIWSQDHKVIAIQYTITAIAIGYNSRRIYELLAPSGRAFNNLLASFVAAA